MANAPDDAPDPENVTVAFHRDTASFADGVWLRVNKDIVHVDFLQYNRYDQEPTRATTVARLVIPKDLALKFHSLLNEQIEKATLEADDA